MVATTIDNNWNSNNFYRSSLETKILKAEKIKQRNKQEYKQITQKINTNKWNWYIYINIYIYRNRQTNKNNNKQAKEETVIN